tara:strand:+ start:3022 stop:3354 length:333 start_codon:yes stop_codon:yes gene_type:complete
MPKQEVARLMKEGKSEREAVAISYGEAGKKKRKKSKKKRTAKGNITAGTRDKTATLSDSRFPIFDAKSASSALKLRGNGTTPEERAKIIRKASKYLPEAAKKAKEEDKRK